jgi:hypothetical protein
MDLLNSEGVAFTTEQVPNPPFIEERMGVLVTE